MGEDSLAADVFHAKHRLNIAPLPSAPAESQHLNGADEPYTIKCICGYDDDAFDGNVVLCDRCNSWQHIACYYHPQTNLEEDFEHVCVDCDESRRSRFRLNAAAAALRQANLRPSSALTEARRQKRLGAKNHKKSRTRDLGHATDSWPNNGDSHLSEGRADSPRENGPPPKRSKTSHKHSASTNNIHSRPVNGRKRSESLPGAPEPLKVPLNQCPSDYFSPEFIRVHHENTAFRPTETNVHHNLDVATLLSTWLDDPDAFNAATNQTHQNAFKQFPQPLEELETPIQKHIYIDKDVEFHGRHPTWPYLAVETDLMAGDYVGELKGSIGRREDYFKEESNNWSKLRHPDHFVFFHPILPIYIDSRTEGTLLRYARRSCHPNMKMETIITGAREYRFCFTAIKEIPRGTELTIPWDTAHDPQLHKALAAASEHTTDQDAAHISDWVGTVLAHFGGCACETFTDDEPDHPCLLAHFDRRLADKMSRLLQRNGKVMRKKKKSRPDADRPANSRASSDGPVNQDNDVDMADDRSQTHSSDSKSSRDGTPYYSATGHQELSERDKRKLMQQEKLFEQMEQDTQQTGQRKRKRNSGSNAPTPTATTHRNFGRSSSSQAVNNKPRGPVSPDSTSDSRTPVGRSVAASPGHGRSAKPTTQRPVYVDASTQTEEPVVQPKPKYGPLPCRTKQLLRRSLLHNHRKRHTHVEPPAADAPSEKAGAEDATESTSVAPAAPAPQSDPVAKDDVITLKTEGLSGGEPMDISLERPPLETPQSSVPDSEQIKLSIEVETDHDMTAEADLKSEPVQPIEQQPPALIDADSADKENHERESEPGPEVDEPLVAPVAPMHIDLPNDFTKPATPTESPLQTPTGSNATAPLSVTTPSSESAAKPDVKKKKMSLSDYLNKRKTETPATEKTQSQALTKATSPSDEMTKESSSTPKSTAAA